jgi:carboxymethylenebutenolidase
MCRPGLAAGAEGVRTFYDKRLGGRIFPPDVTFKTICRTYSAERLLDELIIAFTHTIDWMLPGLEPTCKPVNAMFVVFVGIGDGKVPSDHIHWDPASVLAQIGLLDRANVPVVGAGAAAKPGNPALPDPFFGEGRGHDFGESRAGRRIIRRQRASRTLWGLEIRCSRSTRMTWPY